MNRAEEKRAASKAKLERAIEAKRVAKEKAVLAEAERKRAEAQARQALQADFEAAVARRLEQEVEGLREELEQEYAEQMAAAEETSAARKKREKADQRRATESAQRLERAKDAEDKVKALEAQIDELHEKLQHVAVRREEASDDDEEAPGRREAGRSSDGRRLAPFTWTTRCLFHCWLARSTPPATAGANYSDAAKHFAQHQQVRQPSLAWIRKLRVETTILGEACAGLQVLCAKRIVSFGFDESTKLGNGVASTNLQIETQDGELLDVVLRGAFVIPGGTAEQVSAAMESKLFAHCRELLRKWKGVYEQMCGEGRWPFPDPSRLGYHQLGGSLIMSDTCKAARAAKRLIMDNAARAIEADVGPAAWAALSEEDQAAKTRMYVGDCMQHLRNVLLAAMSSAATSHLAAELEESLAAFSSFKRMSTDIMQLIRAVEFATFSGRGRHLVVRVENPVRTEAAAQVDGGVVIERTSDV
eukprot:3109074-Prymnesium_polylepis.1